VGRIHRHTQVDKTGQGSQSRATRSIHPELANFQNGNSAAGKTSRTAARLDTQEYQNTNRRLCTVSDDIIYVTDATFESEVLNAPDPVLVDYWAEWCGPCKMIAPILDEIANEYAGKIRIAKLNIDDNPQTPPKYGIRGIPTLMLFKDGQVEATKVGALSKSQLTAFIDSNI
jgi:thioredoxin 1